MAFDDRRIACSGLDHIRVDRALNQIVHTPDLLGLFLKDANELLTDDLTLALRLCDAGQLLQKALLPVGTDKVDVPLGKSGLDLISLIFTHEAMVDKYTGELASHRLGQQCRSHGRIHAAGKSQQHFAVSNLLTNGRDGCLAVVLHGPVSLGTAHQIEEIANHGHAIFCMVDLRMVLHAVKTACLITDGHIGAVVAVSGEGKARGHHGHVVPMAHPGVPSAGRP